MSDVDKQYMWAFQRTRQLLLEFIKEFPDDGNLSLCAYVVFTYAGSAIKATEGMARVMEHLEVIKTAPDKTTNVSNH